MQGPISLVPWGLGNLLGLKGDSGVFRYIEDNAQFSMDLWDLIATQNCLERLAQSNTAAAVGLVAYTTMTVPSGEAWLVRGCGFSAQAAAGENIRANMLLVNSTGSGTRALTDDMTSSLTDAVGVGAAAGQCTGPAFFMAPGDALGVLVKKITTAGTISISTVATIYRFKT